MAQDLGHFHQHAPRICLATAETRLPGQTRTLPAGTHLVPRLRACVQALARDAAFSRLESGKYALAAFQLAAPSARPRRAKGPRAPRVPKVLNHAQHSAEVSGGYAAWDTPHAMHDEEDGSQPELIDTVYSSADWYSEAQPLSALEQDDLNHAEAETTVQARSPPRSPVPAGDCASLGTSCLRYVPLCRLCAACPH